MHALTVVTRKIAILSEQNADALARIKRVDLLVPDAEDLLEGSAREASEMAKVTGGMGGMMPGLF